MKKLDYVPISSIFLGGDSVYRLWHIRFFGLFVVVKDNSHKLETQPIVVNFSLNYQRLISDMETKLTTERKIDKLTASNSKTMIK